MTFLSLLPQITCLAPQVLSKSHEMAVFSIRSLANFDQNFFSKPILPWCSRHLIHSTWIVVVAIPDLWSSLMNQNWPRIPYFHVGICIWILQKMHSSFDSTQLLWNITASLSSTCSPPLHLCGWTNSSGGHSMNFETVDKLKHLPRFFLINF